MEILRFLFYAFLLYLAFRLIFDFIIPVVRTTMRIKKGFREMHERMNQHTEQFRQQEIHPKQNQSNDNQSRGGDYIDFEEVKD